MYLLEGQLNTLMLAPYYPEGYKGGYVYAGNYKLMHKLAITSNKVIMRPCGKLVFPENYSLALARYDRFSNKDKIIRPSKFLNDKQLLIEEQRPFNLPEVFNLMNKLEEEGKTTSEDYNKYPNGFTLPGNFFEELKKRRNS